MSEVERVVLLGPIAEPDKPARGGYESANLRLSNVLATLVSEVDLLPYPQTSGSQGRKTMQYARAFSILILRVLARSGRGAAVHFTPYCRHFLGVELFLAAAAHLRGYALTIDLRAGMQKRWYEQSSFVYRRMFRWLLSASSAITYEGETYGAWLKTLAPGKTAIWLPNFVPAAMLLKRREGILPASPRLIYVGTISRDKGVESALRVFQHLRQQFPGTILTLVGACDAGYRAELDDLGLTGESVAFTGALTPAEVESRLDESHFFLFLTRWFGEGHSNALTEAMARGCVPVASDHGFNASVIGTTELLLADGDDVESGASLIAALWSTGRWRHLSAAMVARVGEHFTDRQARQSLARIYGDQVSSLLQALAPRNDTA